MKIDKLGFYRTRDHGIIHVHNITDKNEMFPVCGTTANHNNPSVKDLEFWMRSGEYTTKGSSWCIVEYLDPKLYPEEYI